MHPDATVAVEQLRPRSANMGVPIEISSAEKTVDLVLAPITMKIILELIGSRMKRLRMKGRVTTQRTTHNQYHLCPYTKDRKATYIVHDICILARIKYVSIVFIDPATIFVCIVLRF